MGSSNPSDTEVDQSEQLYSPENSYEEVDMGMGDAPDVHGYMVMGSVTPAPDMPEAMEVEQGDDGATPSPVRTI